MSPILCSIHGKQPTEIVCSHVNQRLHMPGASVYRLRCASDAGALHEEFVCSACAEIVCFEQIPNHVTTEEDVLDVFERIQAIIPHAAACRLCVERLLATSPVELIPTDHDSG